MAVTTFDFDPKLTKMIDQLKSELHASSRAEVLRRAIILLEIASLAKKDGAELVIKKKGRKEQQIILS